MKSEGMVKSEGMELKFEPEGMESFRFVGTRDEDFGGSEGMKSSKKKTTYAYKGAILLISRSRLIDYIWCFKI